MSSNSTCHRWKACFRFKSQLFGSHSIKNIQCRLFEAHSMGSLNVFAMADSSTLQYGVNIKMTNWGGGSLMVGELSCWPLGHMLLVTPQTERVGGGKWVKLSVTSLLSSLRVTVLLKHQVCQLQNSRGLMLYWAAPGRESLQVNMCENEYC